jgi:hypothetical protein
LKCCSQRWVSWWLSDTQPPQRDQLTHLAVSKTVYSAFCNCLPCLSIWTTLWALRSDSLSANFQILLENGWAVCCIYSVSRRHFQSFGAKFEASLHGKQV